jgi:hypothetical protein
MSLILSGTDGLSDVDGTAATPAIRGTDANTGIFFPAADTIAFSEGGAEVARFDSSGQLNIGSTTQNGTTSKLYVRQATDNGFKGLSVISSASQQYVGSFSIISGGILDINQSYLDGSGSYQPISFTTSGSERMRIDSAGNVGININPAGDGRFVVQAAGSAQPMIRLYNSDTGSASQNFISFRRNNVDVGSISGTNTATSYNTSSDYRLKENIAPMTGALDKVQALKPVTYDWKTGGSSQGFIAHELQAIVPDCVTGEKDAVETYTDEDGNEQTRIKPQGIDTSFLVATLTAAIQELKAIVDAQAIEIAELKAK